MKTQNKKGFTIVELVIVIAVIAILAAVLIPTFINLTKKANESADIQACRNMNTFLTTAKVTGDIKSPMDIYDVFKNSGYAVESYTPLSADHHYYYDDQYNQVLYVDTETGKVVYPSEHKDEKKEDNHNWYSLSMTVVSMKQPARDKYSDSGNIITATVANAAEYAFVIDAYNNAADNTSLTLTLAEDIDLQGAYCAIKEAKGTVTIDGAGHTIKNGASNKAITQSTANSSGQKSDYNVSPFICKVIGSAKVTVKNVTFENMNAKTITGGDVAPIAGCVEGNLTLIKVTVRNSTAIGHRNVSAVIGSVGSDGKLTIEGSLTIKDVKVLTIGGRSALICKVSDTNQLSIVSGAIISIENSSVGIYNNPESKQKVLDVVPDGVDPKQVYELKYQESVIMSIKNFNDGGKPEYSYYGYHSGAIVTFLSGDKDKDMFYTSVDGVKKEFGA